MNMVYTLCLCLDEREYTQSFDVNIFGAGEVLPEAEPSMVVWIMFEVRILAGAYI
jgi:hypothetical protein